MKFSTLAILSIKISFQWMVTWDFKEKRRWDKSFHKVNDKLLVLHFNPGIRDWVSLQRNKSYIYKVNRSSSKGASVKSLSEAFELLHTIQPPTGIGIFMHWLTGNFIIKIRLFYSICYYMYTREWGFFETHSKNANYILKCKSQKDSAIQMTK